MKIIQRGEDVQVTYYAKNQSGAVIDLTDKEITFKLKVSSLTNIALIEKYNTEAGGGDDEIKVISADKGILVIKILGSETAGLIDKDFFAEITIDTERTINEIIRIKPFNAITSSGYRTSGTTEQRPELADGTNIGFAYFDIDYGYTFWWDGTEWIDPYIVID